MRRGQTQKAFSKFFTERRMEVEVAEEPKAEKRRLEEALSVANTEFIDKDSPGGEPAKLNQEGARDYVSVGRADSL